MSADWRLGPIGFAYDDWAGTFYPPGLQPDRRLSTLAASYSTVELDTTFYACPTPERVRIWAEATPADFRFLVKAPREITHEDRLAMMGEFVQCLGAFGERLGSVLLQFPPGFSPRSEPSLQRLLDALHGWPCAVEFRHSGWWQGNATQRFLKERNVTWVAADLAPIGQAGETPLEGRYVPFPPQDTGEFLYWRLNGIHAQYDSDGYEAVDATPRLRWWLDQLGAFLTPGRRVYAVCGNSFAGHAPATLRRLADLLGLPTPEPLQPRLF